MYKYILKRILLSVGILIGISFIIYFILYITPGDPARTKLGTTASEESVQELREEWGLNEPFLVQYVTYMKKLLHGDFGTSYRNGKSVLEEIQTRYKVTIPLQVFALILAMGIGISFGIYAAVKQYSIIDFSTQGLAMLLQAFPDFLIAMLLMLVFSLKLGWLPSAGNSTPLHFILPCIAVSASSVGGMMRMTKSSMLEVIRADYVRTAKAKGATESRVIFRHCVRNAMLPVLTNIGTQFAFMMGGAVAIETVFAMNGMGAYLLDSIINKNIPCVMGSVLIMAAMVCLVNLIVDCLYGVFDPRIRAQYTGR